MNTIEQMIHTLCPDGVKRVRLGELAKVITAPKKLGKKDYLPNGLYPIVDQGQKFVIAYTNDESVLVPKDDYVIFGDHTREIKFVDFAFAQGADGVKILRAKACILPRFLYYSMTNLDIVNRGYNRHWTIVQDMEIPLPPLPIQGEIVKILDRFAVLTAELEAELEGRRKQYEYYRTLLLDFSEGKKQAYEGQRDPRTRLLSFDSSSDTNAVRWMRLGEVGSFFGGLTGKNKDDFKDGNAAFITYMNIYKNIAVDIHPTEKVRINASENQNTLHLGDILFTGSSETPDECGISSVVTQEPEEPLYLNSFCFGYRFNDNTLFLPKYIKHWMRSGYMRKAIGRTANGVTRFNVSKKEMAKIKIPLISIEEQERIAFILDKFDQLVNGVKDSIPSLIDDVQKQYEFYRNKLLTFPE